MKTYHASDKGSKATRTLQGIGASPGMVIGKVVVIKRQTCRAGRYHLPKESIPMEVERFNRAVTMAENDLVRLKEHFAQDLADALSIIDSHILMLKDRLLYDRTVAIIQESNVNAEWALSQTLRQIKERFEQIADPYIKERYADIKHVADRVFGLLFGREPYQVIQGDDPVIVAANEFSPEDTMQLHGENILGFLSEKGGVTSHTAIVARSLNIPAVIGLTHVTGVIATGDTVIVDGSTGEVVVNPDTDQLKRFRVIADKRTGAGNDLMQYVHLSAETFDGYTVSLSANIEKTGELETAMKYGCEGIGLFRSEFDFFQRDPRPDEEGLLLSYKELLQAMSPHSVTVRTLDVGGDKFLDHLPDHHSQLDHERNPALGLRSIRFSLYETELFTMQLRALFRASVYGHLKILLPLVSSLPELYQVKKIISEVMDQLTKENIPFDSGIELGVMVEVPSAVVLADVFAREVDFLAVGTNDLIQYSLAIDRSNQHVAHMYDPFHPAVLRMIKQTIDAGHSCGKPVSVCGEMAGDTLCAAVLFGFGVDQLSMRPAVVPNIKRLLRYSRYQQLLQLGEKVLQCKDGLEVKKSLAAYFSKFYSQHITSH